MLGRKQSLKGDPVLADYGPEESLNESTDIEWVNKVTKTLDPLCQQTVVFTPKYAIYAFIYLFICQKKALGPSANASLCTSIVGLGMHEHSQDF